MVGKRFDVYKAVTEQLIAMMDEGTVPWHKPWFCGQPRNLVSGKPYRGINAFLLGLLTGPGQSSPFWLTFKQAKQLGGSVRKGEKSTMVVFWKTGTRKDRDTLDDDGQPLERRFMLARYYRVFNLDQTDEVRIPQPRQEEMAGHEPPTPGERLDLDQGDQVFADYAAKWKIDVQHGHPRAAFDIKADRIIIPDADTFSGPEEYHCTRFHEAVHSTGTSLRLKRPGIEQFDYFGSHQYSEEELVAEIGASLLMGVCGIERKTVLENSAAYLRTWRRKLTADPKIIVTAAQRAQKAADFILDEQPEEQPAEAETDDEEVPVKAAV